MSVRSYPIVLCLQCPGKWPALVLVGRVEVLFAITSAASSVWCCAVQKSVSAYTNGLHVEDSCSRFGGP